MRCWLPRTLGPGLARASLTWGMMGGVSYVQDKACLRVQGVGNTWITRQGHGDQPLPQRDPGELPGIAYVKRCSCYSQDSTSMTLLHSQPSVTNKCAWSPNLWPESVCPTMSPKSELLHPLPPGPGGQSRPQRGVLRGARRLGVKSKLCLHMVM